MAERVTAVSWLEVARRYERHLAILWIGGVLLLFAGMAARPIRLRVLDKLQAAALWYDLRWDRRLVDGEQLVAARRFDEAIVYLEQLDANFPARTSRQGRDKEREHLLQLLALSYEATDRKAKAMATWERLVAFDSLNYRNHFGYGQAAERLLSGWAVAPEARDGFARALLRLPSHLPSLRGFVAYYADRGEFREVAAAYRTYLDSFLLEYISLRAGDSVRHIPILVDGRAHDVEVDLPLPAGWNGDLVLSAGPYPMSVERIALVSSVLVGEAASRGLREISLSTMSTPGMTRSGAGWVPSDSTSALRIPVQVDNAGSTRVLLRLRTFKLLDEPLWIRIAKGHRNLLDAPGLADAESRTAMFKSPQAADSAFHQVEWSQGGQYVRGSR